jgi:hypothetical protein
MKVLHFENDSYSNVSLEKLKLCVDVNFENFNSQEGLRKHLHVNLYDALSLILVFVRGILNLGTD